jgi:hypothetical protein
MVSYPADFITSQPQAFNLENIARAWRVLALALDAQMPGWRTTNADPKWVAWLHGLDALTKLPRQRLLDDAVARKDVGGVVALFRDFASQHGRVAVHEPVQPYPRGAKPTYTRQQILDMSKRRQKGQIDDTTWWRWEEEMIAAGREGRILGAQPVGTR